MPIQSRVIMVVRFKGVCTPTSPCPPVKGNTGVQRHGKAPQQRTEVEDTRVLISHLFKGASFLSRSREKCLRLIPGLDKTCRVSLFLHFVL